MKQSKRGKVAEADKSSISYSAGSTPAPATDYELAQEALRTDKALEAMFEKYRRFVYFFARIYGVGKVTDELICAGQFGIYKGLLAYKGNIKLSAQIWLYVRRYIHEQAEYNRELLPYMGANWLVCDGVPEPMPRTSQQVKDIGIAFSRLRRTEQAWLYRYWLDIPMRQMAKLLGVSVQVVNWREKAALKRLKELYEKEQNS